MSKRTITRFYPLVVGVLFSVAVFGFVARRVVGTDSMGVLEAILAVLAVLALGLGYWAAKTPREISSFGDPTLDAEIDRTLRRRASSKEE